jgi:tetratricopeptide (TPR) repeat protein
MPTAASLFISYRRSQSTCVRKVVEALEAIGIPVFFDQAEIDPLEDFPKRLREGIDKSYAMLVWWCHDYAESSHCMDELQLAWQHTRRQTSDVSQRIWIVNPEKTVAHITAGELNAKNFLSPPTADQISDWCTPLRERLDALASIGPFSDERRSTTNASLAGTPVVSREFVGRGKQLWKIHSLLHPARLGDIRGVAVQTYGMGGIGKTELAAAYANRFAAAYPGGVFWLNFASYQESTWSEQGAEAAWVNALEIALQKHPWCNSEPPQLRFLDADSKPVSAARLAFQVNTLLEGKSSLWIFDNIPHNIRPAVLRDTILNRLAKLIENARTLITTRDSGAMNGLAALPLDVLTDEEGLRLLTAGHKLSAPERTAAIALVTEVGGHALALTLLRARARAGGGFLSQLASVREQGALVRLEKIADDYKASLGTYARSLLATFALSFDALNEDASCILAIASCCAPNEPIPLSLLEAAFASLVGSEDTTSIGDRCAVAITELTAASLLLTRREAEGEHGEEIHPLVASAARVREPQSSKAADSALRDTYEQLFNEASDIREHPRMLPALLHALHVVINSRSADIIKIGIRIGQLERARGRYASARGVEEHVLRVTSTVLGDEHPATLTAMNNLAGTLRAQGDLAGARELYEKVLDIRRRVLGEEHPGTLTSMNNLAATLWAQGDLAGARALQEKVLDIQPRVLGDEHPDTLTSMNNLAATLFEQGDFAGARTLQEKALDIRCRVLGEEHPNTLNSMNSLAGTLSSQGDLAGARVLYETALTGLHRTLGASHPSTLQAEQNLAVLMAKIKGTEA